MMIFEYKPLLYNDLYSQFSHRPRFDRLHLPRATADGTDAPAYVNFEPKRRKMSRLGSKFGEAEDWSEAPYYGLKRDGTSTEGPSRSGGRASAPPRAAGSTTSSWSTRST